jgi:hypothetical protein
MEGEGERKKSFYWSFEAWNGNLNSSSRNHFARAPHRNFFGLG